MTGKRFKELFATEDTKHPFWVLVSYYQNEWDPFYYNKGYNYCMQNDNYPTERIGSNNPYKKDTLAYSDYEDGFNKAFAEIELAYSLSWQRT